MRVTADEIENERAGPEQSERRPVSLTSRDRELFVHLAIARFLTVEQIAKIVFPGKSDSIARRRLSRLGGGKFPYVRRLPFRTRAGGAALAWSLKPLGYMAANNCFEGTPEPPKHDPGAEFLEHDILLNDLYVGLAAAAKRKKLSFDRWPFRWLPSDSARLPWTEYDRGASSTANRLICPDATLELLQAKRRVFIEFETGTHTLGFQRDVPGARNATKTKIDRYTRFVASPALDDPRRTSYSQAFSDGWPAQLLFIVPNRTRRDAITQFVAASHTPPPGAAGFSIRALTFDEAPANLCGAAKLSSESELVTPVVASSIALSADDARALYEFYNGAIAAIAAVRQVVRANPHLASLLPAPEYPPHHDMVKALCMRIRSSGL